ncbi:MAG TPA: hypothetical protein VMZ90_03180, partial [Vicinamibacterales bacterium]|nr:hypothetical protein [Vicinamibacterales bacterium]
RPPVGVSHLLAGEDSHERLASVSRVCESRNPPWRFALRRGTPALSWARHALYLRRGKVAL